MRLVRIKGGWMAVIPGCGVAGRTRREARQAMREARRKHAEIMARG